jgi:hypothetical protein
LPRDRGYNLPVARDAVRINPRTLLFDGSGRPPDWLAGRNRVAPFWEMQCARKYLAACANVSSGSLRPTRPGECLSERLLRSAKWTFSSGGVVRLASRARQKNRSSLNWVSAHYAKVVRCDAQVIATICTLRDIEPVAFANHDRTMCFCSPIGERKADQLLIEGKRLNLELPYNSVIMLPWSPCPWNMVIAECPVFFVTSATSSLGYLFELRS